MPPARLCRWLSRAARKEKSGSCMMVVSVWLRPWRATPRSSSPSWRPHCHHGGISGPGDWHRARRSSKRGWHSTCSRRRRRRSMRYRVREARSSVMGSINRVGSGDSGEGRENRVNLESFYFSLFSSVVFSSIPPHPSWPTA